MARAYYNDNDPFVVEWQGNLLDAGLAMPGTVDPRDISLVAAADLTGYTQCHFFAGILGWPMALRLARWPESREVWTASLPCQPFSLAGKRLGEKDERHLWPVFYGLVRQCRPATIVGEQVASPDGYGWLDGVFADLEREGYRCAAADLPACGAGAPHLRQRLFWVADALHAQRRQERHADGGGQGGQGQAPRVDAKTGRVADDESHGLQWRIDPVAGEGAAGEARRPANCGAVGRVGDAAGERLEGYGSARQQVGDEPSGKVQPPVGAGLASDLAPWPAFDLVHCRDDACRRVEPGSFPLAHGVPAKLGLLRSLVQGMGLDPKASERLYRKSREVLRKARRNRVRRLAGYGNAIVPQVAARFLRAYLAVEREEARRAKK